jgi:hypothetical protein
MTAGIYNPTIEQGATFSRTIYWRDGNSVLVDLTSYTARATFRDKFGGTEIVSLTTENGGIALGGAAGTITLTISATATAALAAPSHGVWDLEMITGTTVTRLLQGRFDVSQEVTT